jgi:hypothetical protein
MLDERPAEGGNSFIYLYRSSKSVKGERSYREGAAAMHVKVFDVYFLGRRSQMTGTPATSDQPWNSIYSSRKVGIWKLKFEKSRKYDMTHNGSIMFVVVIVIIVFSTGFCYGQKRSLYDKAAPKPWLLLNHSGSRWRMDIFPRVKLHLGF